MLKNIIRKKIIRLRKKKFKTKYKISIKKIIDILKLEKNKKIVFGGYFTSNYEIDCLSILEQLQNKGFKTSLPVIKNNKQFYRYPIKSTPFEFLLDKNFLISKINTSKLGEIEDKYLFFQILENNNNINVFFSKKNYDLVGWQVEDVYQNLAVTYIFESSINKKIDEKIFKLF